MRSRLFLIAALALAVCQQAQAAPVTGFDFSSTTGSAISFDGSSHFQFTNGSVGTNTSFQIQLESGGTGGLVGLYGTITNQYTIGTVTTSGSAQSAPVTGNGTFVIHDGSGSDFTATVSWINIKTDGSGTTLNTAASFNLTNLAYSGSNADLLSLATSSHAGVTVTTQLAPPFTLSYLKANAKSSTYSGSVTAVPEPASMVIAGIGIAGLAGASFRRRRQAVVA